MPRTLSWTRMSSAMRVEAAPPGTSHQVHEDFLTDLANFPPAGVDAQASFMSAEMAALWAAQHASMSHSQLLAGDDVAGWTDDRVQRQSQRDTARDTLGLVQTVQLLSSGPMRTAEAAKLVDGAPRPLLDMVGTARHLRGVGCVACCCVRTLYQLYLTCLHCAGHAGTRRGHWQRQPSLCRLAMTCSRRRWMPRVQAPSTCSLLVRTRVELLRSRRRQAQLLPRAAPSSTWTILRRRTTRFMP